MDGLGLGSRRDSLIGRRRRRARRLAAAPSAPAARRRDLEAARADGAARGASGTARRRGWRTRTGWPTSSGRWRPTRWRRAPTSSSRSPTSGSPPTTRRRSASSRSASRPCGPWSSRCPARSTRSAASCRRPSRRAPPGRPRSASRSARCARPPSSCAARPPSWSPRCARRRCAASGASCSCGGWSRPRGCSRTSTSSSRTRCAPTTACCGRTWWCKLAGGKNVVVDAKVAFLGFLDAAQATDERGAHRAARRPRAARPHARRRPGGQALLGPVRAGAGVRRDVRARRVVPARGRRAGPAADRVRVRAQRRHRDARSRCWRCCGRSRTPGGRTRWPATRRRCSRSARSCTGGSRRWASHLAKLGRAIDSAAGAYNQTVSSLETRVLVSARRFADLHVVDARPADARPRRTRGCPRVSAPELVASAEEQIVDVRRPRAASGRAGAARASGVGRDARRDRRPAPSRPAGRRRVELRAGRAATSARAATSSERRPSRRGHAARTGPCRRP